MNRVVLFHRIKQPCNGTMEMDFGPNNGALKEEFYIYFGIEDILIPSGGAILAVIAGEGTKHFVWKNSKFEQTRQENSSYEVRNDGAFPYCFINGCTLQSLNDQVDITVCKASVPTHSIVQSATRKIRSHRI